MMKFGTVPTLEDVAAAAGVSTATVSRCLSAPDRVAEKTRINVLNIVKELGYTPNFGAQALAAKRTNILGAVIPTMNNAIFAAGLEAFQQELGKQGKTLLLASSFYDNQTEEEQIRSLIAKGVDGLLLIGTRRSDEIYRFIEERDIPIVLAWTHETLSHHASVGFDNFAAMRGLARKALWLGHKRFAMISAARQTNDRADKRVMGIEAALQEYGAGNEELTVFETSYSIENGRSFFEKAMQLEQRPTLVVCGNDVLAAGAYKAAHSMGLSIPKDVSITGFDDIELASVLEPQLTTVRVPHREMGMNAAKILLKMIENRDQHQTVCLPTQIVKGGSLGPPLLK